MKNRGRLETVVKVMYVIALAFAGLVLCDIRGVYYEFEKFLDPEVAWLAGAYMRFLPVLAAFGFLTALASFLPRRLRKEAPFLLISACIFIMLVAGMILSLYLIDAMTLFQGEPYLVNETLWIRT